MSNSQQSYQSGGVGFTGLLAVAFIVLKLIGVIHWSWWWVTAPLWGGLAIFIAIMIVLLLVLGIGELIGGHQRPPR
jgi:hypothetical protein